MSRPSAPLLAVAVVAAGGAGGAVLRWWLGELAPDESGFPWTTFGINVAGSFVLACLPALAVVRHRVLVALALGPGAMGGFTTLSTYAEEGRTLLALGEVGTAAAYVLGTLAACLAAVWVGHRLSTPADQLRFDAEEGNE